MRLSCLPPFEIYCRNLPGCISTSFRKVRKTAHTRRANCRSTPDFQQRRGENPSRLNEKLRCSLDCWHAHRARRRWVRSWAKLKEVNSGYELDTMVVDRERRCGKFDPNTTYSGNDSYPSSYTLVQRPRTYIDPFNSCHPPRLNSRKELSL